MVAMQTYLITTREVARLLAIAPDTLRQWRSRGYGPPYVSVSRGAVRYDPAAIAAWLASRTARPGERREAS